jgi:hypothetical protein
MNIEDIIKYEEGRLNDAQTLRLFSNLIRSGEVWGLQGHYGRTASAMIQDGWISRSGELQDKCYDNGIL